MEPDSASRPSRPARWIRALGRSARAFLETIGIIPESRDVDHAAQLVRFKLFHTEFRKLLTHNNSFLETLADLEGMRRGPAFVDKALIKRKVVRAVADVHAMVQSINVISAGRYAALGPAFDRINAAILAAMEEETPGAPVPELVLELSRIRASHGDLVGGKMANLGELRNKLGLPTPEGFAVTTEAFRLLLEEAGLRSWIQSEHMDLRGPQEIRAFSEALGARLAGATLPQAVREAMGGALARLLSALGPEPGLAVRSSALGEDSRLSFAGQFRSLLNVPPSGLPEAYIQVVASLYSPEAIHYRLLHGIPGESAQMAVGVLEMVPAVASGVIFSRDPARPDSGELLIQAVHGMGVSLVDGRTSPELLRVSLGDGGAQVHRTASSQTQRVVPTHGGGIREEALPLEETGVPCITDEEAVQLARWTKTLEAHFGGPQDVEWAVDRARRMRLLQSRPLRLASRPAREEAPVPGHRVLLESGETASPGVASGPAVLMDEDGDLDAFPAGGILVTRRSSPKFVRLMARAKGIVADAGSTTGHMASLARELGVPALLNTRTATRAVPAGALITLDASGGRVYAGEVPALSAREAEAAPGQEADAPRSASPEIRLLEQAAQWIAPLHLTDPRASDFAPEGCRTLHDIARFVHEKSYAEMFGLGEQLGDFRAASYQLDVFLPVDLYIIDLGGGLKEMPPGRKVRRSQIASVPMKALLDGMLHEKIPRFGARPMDLGGLFSVMMRHAATTPEQDRSFADPCYALISDSYLNYTARVGYHFSVVDTYCSPTPNKNYISLVFRGGAADLVRRSRRIRAIGGILKEYGFSVSMGPDFVTARLSKAPQDETRAQLEMLGRLLQFFRQMDAAMASDQHARLIQEAFLEGDYDLSEAMARGRTR